MKKTVKINISGIIFYLDEDANEKLKKYFNKIQSHFGDKTDGEDIIKDIKLRVAELFQLKLSNNKEVITLEDVEEIIGKLGEPEEFFDEAESHKEKQQKKAKKLYRDPDNAILGGVAAGLGQYFNTDPVWFRLLFIVLVFGYGIIAIIYILLWLIIPKAETYAQKLEMQGENLSISFIEQKARQEYEEVKNNFQNIKKTKEYNNITKGLNEIFMVIGNFFKQLFKFIFIIIGVSLVIAALAIALSFLGIPFSGYPFFAPEIISINEFPFSLFIKTIFDPVLINILILAALLIALIPLLLLIYLVFRLIGLKANDKVILSGGLAIWVIALFTMIGVTIWQTKNYAYSATQIEEHSINAEQSIITTAIIKESNPTYYLNELSFIKEKNLAGIDDPGNIYLKPQLTIKPSSTRENKIEIKHTSRGKSFKDAASNTKKIEYDIQINNEEIKFPSFYILPQREKYRIQQVKTTIYLAEGQSIFISPELVEYLQYTNNNNGYSPDQLAGKIWKMENGKLSEAKNSTLHKRD
ncbi:MAG: PspC domain-containing protein [Bacteroidales bacterium]